MEKLCECGCGNPAPIAKKSNTKRGHIKGHPIRFISGHHNWNGGKTYSGDGRLLINKTRHPRANSVGFVRNSVLIAEKALGKFLDKKHPVHHFDNNTGNDKNRNLVICEDQAYHLLLHQRKRAYDACGNASWLKCYICQQYDDPKNLYIYPKGNSGYHKHCKSNQQKEQYKRVKDL